MDNDYYTDAQRTRDIEVVTALEDLIRDTLRALYLRDPAPATYDLGHILVRIIEIVGQTPSDIYLASGIQIALRAFDDPPNLNIDEEMRREAARAGIRYLALATDNRGRAFHSSRLSEARQRFDKAMNEARR